MGFFTPPEHPSIVVPVVHLSFDRLVVLESIIDDELQLDDDDSVKTPYLHSRRHSRQIGASVFF